MENRNLLDLDGLTVRYPGGETVLCDVSLHMRAREILCVIGESGCGKSTLLNSILRMPGKVDILSGSIRYRNEDIIRCPPAKLRSIRGAGIGMVYQEPGASLDPIRRIRNQFFDTIRSHKKVTRKQAGEEAKEIFRRLHFEDADRILDSCPVQLSGGMNQRVAIAIAMALHPDVLLADEPTSALDVRVQAQIVRELMRLRNEFGTGILLVTHNIGVVAAAADRVAVMYGGKVVEFGTRNQILMAPAHPYTRALIAAIPRLDGTPPKGIPGHRTQQFRETGCAFAPRCRYACDACSRRKMQPVKLEGEHWTLCNAGCEGGDDL